MPKTWFTVGEEPMHFREGNPINLLIFIVHLGRAPKMNVMYLAKSFQEHLGQLDRRDQIAKCLACEHVESFGKVRKTENKVTLIVARNYLP